MSGTVEATARKLIGQIGVAIIAATAGGAVIKGLTMPFCRLPLQFPDGGKEL